MDINKIGSFTNMPAGSIQFLFKKYIDEFFADRAVMQS